MNYERLKDNIISVIYLFLFKIGAPRREDVDVTAHSPSGRAVPLRARHPPPSAPGTTASSATFQPDEPGVWTIAITYKGEHIQASISLFLFTEFSSKKNTNSCHS